MTKQITIKNTNETIIVESLGYKDIIHAYKLGAGSRMRTVWQSVEKFDNEYEGEIYSINRYFVMIEGEWFELDRWNRSGCGYSIIL